MENLPTSNVGPEAQINAAAISAPKSRKKAIIVVIMAAVILFGGGGVYAYSILFKSLASDVVIGKMIETLPTLKTWQSNTVLSMKIHYQFTTSTSPSDAANPYSAANAGAFLTQLVGSTTNMLAVAVTSTVDIGDPKNQKSDSQILFTLGGAGQNISLTLGGEIRAIGSTVYAEATNIPQLGFFDASAFEGKWASLDTGALASSTLSVAQPTSTIASNDLRNAFMDPAFLNDRAKDIEDVFVVTKTFPDATINGVATYHYGFLIDPAALHNLLALVVQHASATSDVATAIEGLGDKLQSPTGEAWIDKNDFFLHQIELNLSVDDSVPYYDISANIQATSTFADINAVVTVDIPTVTWDLTKTIASLGQKPTQTSLIENLQQSFNSVMPSGTPFGLVGDAGSQFKFLNIAAANANPQTDFGCNGKIDPVFQEFFYTTQGGASGFCYTIPTANGSDYVKIVGVELELHGNFPALSMTYPVMNPYTGIISYIKANAFLPFAGGYFATTPIGSVFQQGKMGFVMPVNTTSAILNFPGGKLRLNLQY